MKLLEKIHCFDYLRLLKKIINIVKFLFNNKKLRLWVYVTILFFVPLILTIPIPPYAEALKIELTNKPRTESKGVAISQKMQSVGTSFFSKISGISLYEYKTTLCLFNKNEPLLNNQPVDLKKIIDPSEAGAMEVTIEYSNSTTTLYAPPKSTRCKRLLSDLSTSSPVYLLNNPIFRVPAPFGQPIYKSSENGPQIIVPLYDISSIDPSKTRLVVFPVIFSKDWVFSREFYSNYIIFFIAWSIVYSNLLELWEKIKKKYKEAYNKLG